VDAENVTLKGAFLVEGGRAAGDLAFERALFAALISQVPQQTALVLERTAAAAIQ